MWRKGRYSNKFTISLLVAVLDAVRVNTVSTQDRMASLKFRCESFKYGEGEPRDHGGSAYGIVEP